MSECRNWCKGDPILEAYHDYEWCKVSHDDDFQFQMFCLEGASVGLSWRTIMHKRETYLAAFHGFIIDKCAAMSDEELEALRSNRASSGTGARFTASERMPRLYRRFKRSSAPLIHN